MLGAIVAALGGSFFFALAAALQHREALRIGGSGVGGFRVLWKLCHRPWWVVGVASDVLSVALHVIALSMATLSLVQPLGVMGVVFAIPLGAAVRGHRIRPLDLAAAAVVVIGLTVLLRTLPVSTSVHVPALRSVLGLTALTVVLVALATAVARLTAGRRRTLLLAGGAGAAFGATAVLVRTLLLLLEGSGSAAEMIWTGVCVAVLAVGGYLLLQSAYRAGHFAGAVATATVLDPVVAVLAGGFLLRESLPTGPVTLLIIGVSGLLVCAGVALLVRSPASLSLGPVEGSTEPETTDHPDALIR